MSIFREFNISMIPGKPPLIVHASQYESDFVYTFHLVSGKSVLAIPDTAIAVIRGTKRDGNGYSVEAALDAENHKVVVMGDPQLTACAGKNVFELAIINNEKTICTANFFLDVERAPLDSDTIQSETVLHDLQAIINSAATATQAAEEASASAESAASAAEQAVEEKFEDGVAETIDEWLTDHPEATTTVQDGSITEPKLADALKLKTIKDYVTPQMYGAVGDGVTDDTQAFKNMLASGKDMIIIPDGNYYISDTLVFPTGKDVTCIGLLVFHNVTTAVVLGNASINKFNIRSLRISSSSFDETSIGIKIIACIESNFSNLFANLFGTNIYVSGESGVNAYNTFINPIATRGKYNFKVYGPELSKHCNENYIFGGRLFASNNTVRQMSIEGSASSWSVFGLSAEGAGECAVYCDSAYCVFNQIRTEGTWSVAGIVLGENSDRCRVFSTRYDATIEDNGTYNSYITNRMGSKLITSTNNVPALTLQTNLIGSTYDVFKIIIAGNERLRFDGAGNMYVNIVRITQSTWAFKPFKIGNNVFWIYGGMLWTKTSDPESETDGTPVGREYRAFTSSPVDTLTPKFIGDEVLDTAHKIWYKAVGTEKADWVALNSN